jgi:putative transposase
VKKTGEASGARSGDAKPADQRESLFAARSQPLAAPWVRHLCRAKADKDFQAPSGAASSVHGHVVFAVEDRQSLIKPEHNDELQKYITGIVSGQKQKLIAINNVPDHLHMLVGLKPDVALSDLVRDVKAGSSKFINEKHWATGGFSWPEGFGASFYSRSQLGTALRLAFSFLNFLNRKRKRSSSLVIRPKPVLLSGS